MFNVVLVEPEIPQNTVILQGLVLQPAAYCIW